MHHIFIIHSPFNRHLGYFHILDIVNNTAVIMECPSRLNKCATYDVCSRQRNAALAVIDWLWEFLILGPLIKKKILCKIISGSLRLDSSSWTNAMIYFMLSNVCRINKGTLNMEYKKEERERS